MYTMKMSMNFWPFPCLPSSLSCSLAQSIKSGPNLMTLVSKVLVGDFLIGVRSRFGRSLMLFSFNLGPSKMEFCGGGGPFAVDEEDEVFGAARVWWKWRRK
jgi:hypothetical protein